MLLIGLREPRPFPMEIHQALHHPCRKSLRGRITKLNLNADTLKDFINEKKIESMIVAGIDMQGKLFGKKIPAKHFLDIMNEGVYTCAVNLAWDVNLNFLDNYDFCSMETGLHDIKLVPDLTTLRLYPGVEKTAIVLGDLFEKIRNRLRLLPGIY